MVQVVLEAKTKSITTGLMSPLVSSPLTNVSMCHTAMHYDDIFSWQSMTVAYVSVLSSVLVRASDD